MPSSPTEPATSTPGRWFEIRQPGRTVARLQVRADALYGEVSEPERTQLHEAGFRTIQDRVVEDLGTYAASLRGKTIRRVFRFTPPTLPLALTHLPREVEDRVRSERPDWFAWLAEEQARHAARAERAVQLGLRSDCAFPRDRGPLFPEPFLTPDPRWKRTPFAYQAAGVEWLVDALGIGILGDDMGTGKTCMQTLTARTLQSGRSLVLSPAVGLLNWQDEIRSWDPDSLPIPVLAARHLDRCLADMEHHPHGKLIVSWGLVSYVREALLEARFDTVLVDEAHNGCNAESQRGRAMIDLCHRAKHRILATGTAMRNRNKEWWPLLHAIDPLAFPLFVPFGERYCGARTLETAEGASFRTYNGSVRKKELNRLLRPWELRRTKEQVLPQIPKKIRQFLRIPCTDPSLRIDNAKLSKALQAAVSSGGETEGVAQITVLRQKIGLAKVPAALEWIRECVLEQGEPVVVFLYHKAVHEKLREGLGELKIPHGSVVGATSLSERKQMQDRFQAGELDVLLCSTAAKENLTLVRSRFTLHVERWWIPKDEEQAEDRVNRLGQTRGALNVYLQLDGTYDEYVYEVVEEKRADVDAVQERGSIAQAILRRALAGHAARKLRT